MVTAFAASAWAGSFTAGDVVVCRVGDGVETPSAMGNAVFLDEYTTAGTLVQSIALPTTAGNAPQTNPLIADGTATGTNEGLLTTSADGQYVLLTGYATNRGGTTTLGLTACTSVARTIGRVKHDGTIDTTTALTDLACANNPRSATSTDGVDMWAAGASGSTGGAHFLQLGDATSTQLVSIKGARQVTIFGGQLFMTDNQPGFANVNTVGTGLPTTGGQTLAKLPGLPDDTSPAGFFFANVTGGTVLYVADDTAGTVEKYSLVSGSWVANGSVALAGAHGLIGTISGTTVHVYVTDPGALSTFDDTSGYDATITGTPAALVTAPANEGFRGVTLAPQLATGPSATPTVVVATKTATPTSTATPATAATPTPSEPVELPAVQPQAAVACERALGASTAKLVAADLTVLQQCALKALTCIQSNPAGGGRDACLERAHTDCANRRAKVETTRDAMSTNVGTMCSEARVPLAVLRSSAVFGFDKIDPSCTQNAGVSLTSAGAISSCVQQAALCRAERALAIAVPRISDLLVQVLDVESSGLCLPPPTGAVEGVDDPFQAKLALKCQAVTSIAAERLLLHRFSLTQHCAESLLKCRLNDKPVAVCAGIAAACDYQIGQLTTGKDSAIATAVHKFESACGSVAPATLLAADGLGFISASARCNGLGVRPIGSPMQCQPRRGELLEHAQLTCPARSIGTCVARAFDCAASTIVRYALPFADDELGRFGVALTENAFCGEVADWTKDSLAPADLVEFALADMIPTQAVIGYDEIFYKLGRYRANRDNSNKRFDDYCADNGQVAVQSAKPGATLRDPTTFNCALPVGGATPESIFDMKAGIIGPGGRLYLTDGHHNFSAFWELPDGGPDLRIRVLVQGDYRHLDMKAFWNELILENKVWLLDGNGKQISPDDLPQHLGLANMANDPYRALVYFTRDIGYTVPAFPTPPPPFHEFQWGIGLRSLFDLSSYDLTDFATYLDLVKKVSQTMAVLSDTRIVDPRSPLLIGPETALELSKIPAWNAGARETDGEFAKLSKPYSNSKPGKLAYAVQYKDAPGP